MGLASGIESNGRSHLASSLLPPGEGSMCPLCSAAALAAPASLLPESTTAPSAPCCLLGSELDGRQLAATWCRIASLSSCLQRAWPHPTPPRSRPDIFLGIIMSRRPVSAPGWRSRAARTARPPCMLQRSLRSAVVQTHKSRPWSAPAAEISLERLSQAAQIQGDEGSDRLLEVRFGLAQSDLPVGEVVVQVSLVPCILHSLRNRTSSADVFHWQSAFQDTSF
jgi:hypothetical protein